MKHSVWFVMMAILVMGLASCEKAQKINESDLYGYWYESSTNTYMRFMHDDNEMEDGYYLGYEWTVGDKQESDLWSSGDYHKNGWFEWYITQEKKKNTLTLIHLTNSARVPKPYTIKDLSSTHLSYTDGDRTHDLTKTEQPQ